MSDDDGLKAMVDVIPIDRIQNHLGKMVRGTVEDTSPSC